MCRSITISYTISPPEGVSTPSGFAASAEKTYEITPSDGIGSESSAKTANGQMCEALHEAVERARDDIGIDLTAWRDAVGNKEASKEPKKKRDAEEE
ncbi:hypothetical protein BDV98DRAFT_570610 [Pterulicium gracile]|uniref:EKC/KEOPS complex subunit GON7 n=1 Tax=Pterulicium gracile TaxID=1884261 RepID=A0A5C3QGK5_9AGAR|nr:hypothetical protein BDV98DRAFT_570610 [Pterula gracilis]